MCDSDVRNRDLQDRIFIGTVYLRRIVFLVRHNDLMAYFPTLSIISGFLHVRLFNGSARFAQNFIRALVVTQEPYTQTRAINNTNNAATRKSGL
jgi:hypothetical protein